LNFNPTEPSEGLTRERRKEWERKREKWPNLSQIQPNQTQQGREKSIGTVMLILPTPHTGL